MGVGVVKESEREREVVVDGRWVGVVVGERYWDGWRLRKRRKRRRRSKKIV
jgi:hypothetical protein